jgi:hypothetical protein
MLTTQPHPHEDAEVKTLAPIDGEYYDANPKSHY